MTPKVKQPFHSKVLSYAYIDKSNQQTVCHICMTKSQSERGGCGSGTRVRVTVQLKQKVSPLSALPAIQPKVFINLHPMSACDRDRVPQERFTHLMLCKHTHWHAWT